MLRILNIEEHSPLRGKINPGDALIKINGRSVRDPLDYLFLSGDDELKMEFSRGGEFFTLHLKREDDTVPGLIFPQMKPTECGNNCVFCFVDQCPPGVRETLKVKDEDYRFSFLHGNYITLSNLGNAALKRIIEYRLSPLYVSVHALDPASRRRLLNRDKDDGFLNKFRTLLEGGITLHTQIVIVPGYNDGEILLNTLKELGGYHPGVASIGLIPVGLTSHRKNLPKLEAVHPALASTVVETCEYFRRQFIREYDDPVVFAADEMFLMAGMPVPDADYYGDFPQLENGVGMVRLFLDEFKRESQDLPGELTRQLRVLLLSGTAMTPILRENILSRLDEIEGLTLELVEVKNRFFGDTVTVAGLLAGRDILYAVRGREADLILLPPDILNSDNLFIDDLSLDEFNALVDARVKIFDGSFTEILEMLED